MYFEQGPIRPPSEASSLLLRVTRNCPWNRCGFCATYKGKKFSRRTVDEIKKDIDQVVDLAGRIGEYSLQQGHGGEITRQVVMGLHVKGDWQMFHVAYWLYHGGYSVFLQDANSIMVKTEDLVEIIAYLKQKFPSVKRITSYGRSNSILRKSVQELKQLHAVGLSRIHVGLESGSDDVLKYIDKGVTAAQHIEAGQRVVESGLSLSEYVILGMGGKRWTKEHAVKTAEVLNSINPDFIRLRTLSMRRGIAMIEKVQSGEFELLHEDEVVREEKVLISGLKDITSYLASDHSLNLLQEVEGKFPVDKNKMLAVIDKYLSLPDAERLNFRLGKRSNIYLQLSDMEDQEKYNYVQDALLETGEKNPEDIIEYLKNQCL